MKPKFFFVVAFFIFFFLLLVVPLVQASLIETIWYNTLIFLGVIETTNANHLNSDRVIISDIYNEVKELDDIWSETIPSGDYVQVVFEKRLTSSNDITLYPRVVSGDPKIEIYEKNKDELIAEFANLQSNEYNKVYLTNLQGNQDKFDLKVIGGSVEFDYIVDPTTLSTYYLHKSGTTRAIDTTSSAGTLQSEMLQGTTAGTNYSQYNWTARTPYSQTTAISTTTMTSIIFCNVTSTSGTTGVINKVEIYDCGTSTTCAGATVICSDTTSLDCAQKKWNHNVTSICTIGNAYTMHAGDYIGIGISMQTNAKAFQLRLNYNTTTLNSRFNVTEITDTEYPVFYDYRDNNATLNGGGIGNFNVSVNSTNGTVILNINGARVFAFNLTANVYNATYTFSTNRTYLYNWTAYGNGSLNNQNSSPNRYYTVNPDTIAPVITIISPSNGTTYGKIVYFNVSTNENTSWCGLSLDHATDITMTRLNDTYFNYTNDSMSAGDHNVTFACNDTLGNMNVSSGRIYFSNELDTCTCPGLNKDWEIDLSDYCILDDNCNLGTGNLNFTGSGNATCSANINTTNMGDVGPNGILYVKSDCYVLVS